jgi:nicotinate-nucleotide adenylyltransferase
VLGGSFNPVHIGHLILAQGALEALNLEKVLFIPAREPPHKDPSLLAGPAHRLQMLRLAVKGNDRFEISEAELKRRGPSYTVDTMRQLRREYGDDCGLFFLIGADSIPELSSWKDVSALVQLCSIVPIARPGNRSADEIQHLAQAIGEQNAGEILGRLLRVPLVDVSSSDIRRRIAAGLSIRYLVPDPVRRYIEAHQLYR